MGWTKFWRAVDDAKGPIITAARDMGMEREKRIQLLSHGVRSMMLEG